MEENISVSKWSRSSKNPSENVENNLEDSEIEAKEVGGGGLFLFYMFAFVAFMFAMGFLSVVHQCFGTPVCTAAPLRTPAYDVYIHKMLFGDDIIKTEPAQ